MPNEKNLKKNFSRAERQENGRKGAQVTNAKIAARKTLKEELLLLLTKGDTSSRISLALINKALDGDIKAFEVIRDTIGEKPTNEHIISGANTLNITVLKGDDID